MPDSRNLVERFYNDIWNRQDFAAAEEILTPDFRFRGSLGSETIGIPAFLAYAQSIHAALADYRCTIEEMVADDIHIAARMTFTGLHRGRLFGVEATGRTVAWAGAAFFQVAQMRTVSLWVLGDVEGLKQQLGAARSAPFQAG
ncbi:MAG TPA: ester cyclase [Rhizomicrobium sp.]|nr:ester cyclase [Rhizomicrobium sp.]